MMKGGAGEDTGWPGAVEGLGTVRISGGLESDSGQAGLAHCGGSSGRPDDRLRSGFTENELRSSLVPTTLHTCAHCSCHLHRHMHSELCSHLTSPNIAKFWSRLNTC